jgi:hypothetical protein
MRQILGVVWYRFRATSLRRWPLYLALVVLVAFVGGVALGAVAGARRTQSFYPSYLAHTNPSDLVVEANVPGATTANAAYSSLLTKEFAHLPGVRHVVNSTYLLVIPLRKNGTPNPGSALLSAEASPVGSADGEYFDQDRVTVITGRMPDPNSTDEFATDATLAHLAGWHVGEIVPFGSFSTAQFNTPTGVPSGKARHRFDERLVGIVAFNNHAVVHDDVDRYVSYALFTPAFTRSLLAKGEFYPYFTYGLKLDHGSRDIAAVEREVIGILPRGTTYTFYVPSVAEGEVEAAIRPESIALAVFGAIAVLATLLIAAQLIGRELRTDLDDLYVLRALGADPRMTRADGLIGVLGAVLAGSLLAVLVAIGLSPLAPIGAVREVDPRPRVSFDWLVLGLGFAVFTVGLVAVAGVLAYWRSPDRAVRREQQSTGASPPIVNMAMSSGLPAPAKIGVSFALDPGRGRTSVPVRSALLGTALAVLTVVATLTFGSGLQTLVSHPALYGWNWSYVLETANSGSVPPQVGTLLEHDPDVAAWSGFRFANAQIDGQTVPIILERPNAAVTPPILSGHAVEANNQIVLGAATLAQLHKHIGNTVTVSYGTPKDAPVYVPPTRLLVVGTATMPAMGGSGSLHPSMGMGAVLSTGIEPASMAKALASPYRTLNGPAAFVVRLRSQVRPGAGLASMQRIADDATKALAAVPNGQGGGIVVVLSVQRPAEIVNYRSMGATPAVLVSALAVGAIVALGLTLVASARRRRRDLALLKTLGFTKRQLAATTAWQASTVAVIGTVAGVPLGILLGRWLWTLFARGIHAVPDPTVPVISVALVALGALVLANLIALFPGRIAARTRVALLLQSES